MGQKNVNLQLNKFLKIKQCFKVLGVALPFGVYPKHQRAGQRSRNSF